MYAVYKQAHPPTGLEFSMYCNFFSNSERNLVVAGTSQLYVYRLNHDSEVLAKSLLIGVNSLMEELKEDSLPLGVAIV